MWLIKRVGSSAFCTALAAGEAAEFAGCSTEEMELVFASTSKETTAAAEITINNVAYELRRLVLVSSPSAATELKFDNLEIAAEAAAAAGGTRCASPPLVAKMVPLPSSPATPKAVKPLAAAAAAPFQFSLPIFGVYTPQRGGAAEKMREPPPLHRIKRTRGVRKHLELLSSSSAGSAAEGASFSPIDLSGEEYARSSPETVREFAETTDTHEDRIEVVERGIRRKRRAAAPASTPVEQQALDL